MNYTLVFRGAAAQDAGRSGSKRLPLQPLHQFRRQHRPNAFQLLASFHEFLVIGHHRFDLWVTVRQGIDHRIFPVRPHVGETSCEVSIARICQRDEAEQLPGFLLDIHAGPDPPAFRIGGFSHQVHHRKEAPRRGIGDEFSALAEP
jgi:hypothetical protein